MRYIELGENSGRWVGRILAWFFQTIKAAVYSPVVIGFMIVVAILFFNFINIFPSVTESQIFQSIFPEEGDFDKNDILSAYGWTTFIFSLIVSFVSLLVGKRFQLSPKKLFLILAGSSLALWFLATFLLYINGKDSDFIGFGLFFGLGHLVCIAVAVFISRFINPFITLLTGSE